MAYSRCSDLSISAVQKLPFQNVSTYWALGFFLKKFMLIGEEYDTCPVTVLKCDGTRAETRFHLSAKRTSPFKSAGASVQSTTGSRGVRISFYC